MTKRSPIGVFFLALFTLGIYGIVFVNIYWLWKYSQGVEQVTAEKMNAPIAFILIFLLGIIGGAIIQDSFNKVVGNPTPPPPTV
ncbi:MAG: hypothetical protein WD598_14450 [Acidimicrobiia bacterium]